MALQNQLFQQMMQPMRSEPFLTGKMGSQNPTPAEPFNPNPFQNMYQHGQPPAPPSDVWSRMMNNVGPYPMPSQFRPPPFQDTTTQNPNTQIGPFKLKNFTQLVKNVG